MKYWTFCNLESTWERDWHFLVSVDSPELSPELLSDARVYNFRAGTAYPPSTTARIHSLRNPPKETASVIEKDGIFARLDICEKLIQALPQWFQMFPVECEHPIFRSYGCLNVTTMRDCIDLERSDYVLHPGNPKSICAVFQFWIQEDRVRETNVVLRFGNPRGFLLLDELARQTMIKCGIGEEYFSDIQFREYNSCH